MKEWTDIIGYENKYQVNESGEVRSLVGGKNRLRAAHVGGHGYVIIRLSIKNKPKSFPVHRLVALAYVPNPDNKPQVNHKDGNKLNNHHTNLEWCTIQENVAHAVANNLRGKAINHPNLSKPVIQYDLEMNKIAEFPSVQEAARKTGVKREGIFECLRGIAFRNKPNGDRRSAKVTTAGGYIWKRENFSVPTTSTQIKP